MFHIYTVKRRFILNTFANYFKILHIGTVHVTGVLGTNLIIVISKNIKNAQCLY